MGRSHDAKLPSHQDKAGKIKWSSQGYWGLGILAPGRRRGRCSRQTESRQWLWRRRQRHRCQIPRCLAHKGECWKLGPSLQTEHRRAEIEPLYTLCWFKALCWPCAASPWLTSHLHVPTCLKLSKCRTFNDGTRMSWIKKKLSVAALEVLHFSLLKSPPIHSWGNPFCTLVHNQWYLIVITGCARKWRMFMLPSTVDGPVCALDATTFAVCRLNGGWIWRKTRACIWWQACFQMQKWPETLFGCQ